MPCLRQTMQWSQPTEPMAGAILGECLYTECWLSLQVGTRTKVIIDKYTCKRQSLVETVTPKVIRTVPFFWGGYSSKQRLARCVYLFYICHRLILRIENKEEQGMVLLLTRRVYSLYVCISSNPETKTKKRLSRSIIYGRLHCIPLKNTIKIDYTWLPWVAGSSRNHMICNCPTTRQETFNDRYKIKHVSMVISHSRQQFSQKA